MRGVGARMRERFTGLEVRSDWALTMGLVMAGLMVVVVLVATTAAVVQVVD